MEIVLPPKKQIANSFSSSASQYCASAFIQRSILRQCIELMKKSGLSGQSWLDAGSGAGLLAELLHGDISELRFFRSDIAFGSLKRANAQEKGTLVSAQSDIEYLAFKNGMFDGIVVSSVLHWLKDFQQGFSELTRVLKPGGRIVFAAFLQGSFHELGTLRGRMGLSVPVRFIDDDELPFLMKRCGLDLLEVSARNERHYFQSAWHILKYLSEIGSTAISGKRLSRSDLLGFCRDYETMFGTSNGIPLSCRYACGIAKKPDCE
jgi:malonyl-CoA O-methyltransferase